MRRFLLGSATVALALTGACAPASSSGGAPAPSRVLTTDMQGSVIRQQGLNDHARLTFAAPQAKVWTALLASYTELGLEANYADQAGGRYGIRGYTFPKTLKGQRIGTYFDCGSSLSGALVDAGTVIVDVVTTLVPTTDGGTMASIQTVAWARRNDGNASNQVSCSSSGRLEESLRKSVEAKLAAK